MMLAAFRVRGWWALKNQRVVRDEYGLKPVWYAEELRLISGLKNQGMDDLDFGVIDSSGLPKRELFWPPLQAELGQHTT